MRDTTINYIESPADLHRFHVEHRLRTDWHEPDEQGISATVVGSRLDNAFGADGMRPAHPDPEVTASTELRVVISLDAAGDGDGRPVAVINLATLLGWASQLGEELTQTI